MESYKIENLCFTYPDREKATLLDINLTVLKGEFVTLCGKSGCGKTTLLRLLKSSISPFGHLEGDIFFNSKPLSGTDIREQVSEIGFVMQSPENQIVTDKVWHELAFGLESLGYSNAEIRTKVAEMASFFGIDTWFHKKVSELSGGQKQLLNLAAVMVMQPSVLILDEPTSQLDPIAAQEFLKTLERINRELGTTVILTEHRLLDAFAISDRVIVMDGGKIICDSAPEVVGRLLKEMNHDMCAALPAPVRIFTEVGSGSKCPVNIREGRYWLEEYAETKNLSPDLIPEDVTIKQTEKTIIELKDVWFRYEKNLPDVIKGLNFKINEGEILALVGGNGTGKTTALSIMSGLYTPYRGKVIVNGENISDKNNLYNGVIGVLPQSPQVLFVKYTVYSDLLDILSEQKIPEAEKDEKIKIISSVCKIEGLMEMHPYDLSGGEQQRVALAKVLLNSPQIVFLDEPTKGMDAHFKKIFAGILKKLKADGVTVVMVSHDIEFCAENASRCAMFFDGSITSCDVPRRFFKGKSFYTTAANRMARTLLSDAILCEDVILACGGKVEERSDFEISLPRVKGRGEKCIPEQKKLSKGRKILGSVFLVLFLLTTVLSGTNLFKIPVKGLEDIILQLGTIFEIMAAFLCFFPRKDIDIKIAKPKGKHKLTKRSLLSMVFALLAIPLTIYIGVFYFQDRRYYFISLLIILEIMVPFCMLFENRKPQARELVVISVLCAIAVVGRMAFAMLPQFKPVTAIVIIAGVCLGSETGFLVGAITGFVSNFFFGQGPWTPWQMFAYGIIGFVAGALYNRGLLNRNKMSLSVFGGIVSLFLYGGIMNAAHVIFSQAKPTAEMFMLSYLNGLPVDIIHTASTVFFLWIMAEPMVYKLERIKSKYGLLKG